MIKVSDGRFESNAVVEATILPHPTLISIEAMSPLVSPQRHFSGSFGNNSLHIIPPVIF